jgi:hypothetical protein
MTEKSPSDWLLLEVEGFLADTGMAPSTFGLKTVRSGSFVSALRAGRQCHPATIARVRKYIAEGWAEEERAGIEAATAAIDRMGGYVTLESDGSFAMAPDGVPELRLRRMIEKGVLVPNGDSMFGAVSQTYKLSVLAQ